MLLAYLALRTNGYWEIKEKKINVNGEKIKPVVIKPLIISNKGFNTSMPLSDDFLEKLTKRIGSLKINESR